MARSKWDALNAEWQNLRRDLHAPALAIINREVGELDTLVSAENYTEHDLVDMLQRLIFAIVSRKEAPLCPGHRANPPLCAGGSVLPRRGPDRRLERYHER